MKVKIKATGRIITVYASSMRKDMWIDATNCTDEYHIDQLERL